MARYTKKRRHSRKRRSTKATRARLRRVLKKYRARRRRGGVRVGRMTVGRIKKNLARTKCEKCSNLATHHCSVRNYGTVFRCSRHLPKSGREIVLAEKRRRAEHKADRDRKLNSGKYVTVRSAWGTNTYKRTVLPAHDANATKFSWDDPRANYKSDGTQFANYHGAKVYMVDGRLYSKSEAVRKFGQTGTERGGHLHKVLQGEPLLKNLIGPMWGGVWDGKPIMRYDTQETYDSLTV